MRIDSTKRRNAVARIVGGVSSIKDEAQRLGVDRRTVERWVDTARDTAGIRQENPSPVVSDVVLPTVSYPAHPPGQNPSSAVSDAPSALKDALSAAHGHDNTTAMGSDTTPDDAAAAREDMARFCLDTIEQLKMAVGGALVTFRYSPPLDLTDKKVQELLAVGPLATAAIRANAERLYPMLAKWMSGPYQIFGALALDGILMFIALQSLAVERGWKAKPKKEEDTSYTEQIRPRVTPVSRALQEALQPTAPPPAPGQILDAPAFVPSEEAA